MTCQNVPKHPGASLQGAQSHKEHLPFLKRRPRRLQVTIHEKATLLKTQDEERRKSKRHKDKESEREESSREEEGAQRRSFPETGEVRERDASS